MGKILTYEALLGWVIDPKRNEIHSDVYKKRRNFHSMLLWCSNQDEPTNGRSKGSRLIRPLFDQKLWLKWLSRLAQLASSWRKRKTYYLVGPLKGNDMRSFLLANVSPTLVMLLVSVSNNILLKITSQRFQGYRKNICSSLIAERALQFLWISRDPF